MLNQVARRPGDHAQRRAAVFSAVTSALGHTSIFVVVTDLMCSALPFDVHVTQNARRLAARSLW